MNREKNPGSSDLDLLNRLKDLSGFSAETRAELASVLKALNFRRLEVILTEEALTTGVHILLRGVAKITCLSQRGERETTALLAPGLIPGFPSLPVGRWHFRCEAHSACRVGSLSWDQFDHVTRTTPRPALRSVYQNELMRWHRLLPRNLDVRERLVATLHQLCSNFGVTESRGTLLRVSVSHQDLADLTGASRPRITEHLAGLEREQVLIRQGRQLIVCLDKVENSAGVPPSNGNNSLAKARTQLWRRWNEPADYLADLRLPPTKH
jgi:CRP-like cAMP-binding protein